MIEFVFTLEDLARLRFAISPSWEVMTSLRTLRDPSRGAAHLPWVRAARGAVSGLDLRPALALIAWPNYTPDFLTPPPESPLTTIGPELERIAATPVARIRREVAIVAQRHPAPELTAFAEHPRREARRLAGTLAAYWERAIEPSWGRVQALLEADVQGRARQLAEQGAAAVLADLHPAVRWTGDRLCVEAPIDRRLVLDGRGLMVVPSAFAWERPFSVINAPWQPTLIHPARGVGLLWEEHAPAREGLVGVIGRRRADILVGLEAPASTTQLAARLAITPGGVSQHLTAMAAAGLLSHRRDGREVLYARTALGDALAAGSA
jgi:DNA-binding transcriptional ArsR family regulator